MRCTRVKEPPPDEAAKVASERVNPHFIVLQRIFFPHTIVSTVAG